MKTRSFFYKIVILSVFLLQLMAVMSKF